MKLAALTLKFGLGPRSGAPELDLSRKVCGVITQPSPFYRPTLEIELLGDAYSDTEQVEVDSARLEFAFPTRFPLERVVLAPHYRVFHWLPEYRPRSFVRSPVRLSTSVIRPQSTTALIRAEAGAVARGVCSLVHPGRQQIC